MARPIRNKLLNDGKVFCHYCNDSFDRDHFYESEHTGKTTYQCKVKASKRSKENTKSTEKVPRNILLDDGSIYCGKCKKVCDESHFKIVTYAKSSKKKDTIQYICKENDSRLKEDYHRIKYNSKYRFTDKEKYQKDIKLQAVYGITLDEYNNLLEIQDGCCDICKKHFTQFKKPLFVDHDHETGKVRGLLCNTCNGGIGLLKDDLNILNNAVAYLNKYKNK